MKIKFFWIYEISVMFNRSLGFDISEINSVVKMAHILLLAAQLSSAFPETFNVTWK